MRILIFLGLTILLTPLVQAKSSFGLMCVYDPFFKEDNPTMKEIYFFSRISRTTAYYMTFHDTQYVNVDGVRVDYESEENRCKYDMEESNRFFYNCRSIHQGFENAETGIAIDRESLVMLRSSTTARSGRSMMKKFSCKRLGKDESESKLKMFKQQKKELDQRKKNAKKEARDRRKNQI